MSNYNSPTTVAGPMTDDAGVKWRVIYISENILEFYTH